VDLKIVTADLENSDHQAAILRLLNAYALELNGYNKPLSDRVHRELIPELRKIPTVHIFLAKAGGEHIGLAVCFLAFSTFNARPVINIHDFAVVNGHRGKGVGGRLLRAVEEKAKELRCSKMTLEVQEKNTGAIALYERSGFHKAVLDESEGKTLFLSKVLE
jgi:GNAT superfamily N-acetyltransferase